MPNITIAEYFLLIPEPANSRDLDAYITCALLMGLYIFLLCSWVCALIDGDLALDNLVCVTWGWLSIVTCAKAVKTNCLFWFKSKLSKQIKQCQGCQRELNENTQKMQSLKFSKDETVNLSICQRKWLLEFDQLDILALCLFSRLVEAFIWKWVKSANPQGCALINGAIQASHKTMADFNYG